jgi:uncharacterized membrane protein YhaH (DUF805 family)
MKADDRGESTTTGQLAPVPGWYADPAGSGALRYWDGQHWGSELRTAPEPQPDRATSVPDAKPAAAWNDETRTLESMEAVDVGLSSVHPDTVSSAETFEASAGSDEPTNVTDAIIDDMAVHDASVWAATSSAPTSSDQTASSQTDAAPASQAIAPAPATEDRFAVDDPLRRRARSTETPIADLEELSNHHGWQIRADVARNPLTPRRVNRDLLGDPDPRVRAAALKSRERPTPRHLMATATSAPSLGSTSVTSPAWQAAGPPASTAGGSVRFGEAIRIGFSKWTDFRGRASRPEYWWFATLAAGAGLVAALIHIAVFFLVGLVFFIPHLAVGFRRLHDTGRSGAWLVWLNLLPGGFYMLAMLAFVGGSLGAGLTMLFISSGVSVVGGIVLLVLLAQPGQPAANRYGPPMLHPTAR